MNTNTKQSINVGVDSGKTQLDIYVRPIDHFFTVKNNEEGIKQAIKVIQQYYPERVVIEAKGRLEMPCYQRVSLYHVLSKSCAYKEIAR